MCDTTETGHAPEARSGHQGLAGDAGACDAAAEEIAERLHELEFDCLRRAHYHALRRDHLDARHRWAMFAAVIGGTSVYATVMGSAGTYATMAAAALPVLAATLDLVFDIPGRARDHAESAKRFTRLLGDLAAVRASGVGLAELERERLTAIADAPARYMRALDSLCHNAVCRHYGSKTGMLAVPWLHRRLRNWVSYSDHVYEPAPEGQG